VCLCVCVSVCVCVCVSVCLCVCVSAPVHVSLHACVSRSQKQAKAAQEADAAKAATGASALVSPHAVKLRIVGPRQPDQHAQDAVSVGVEATVSCIVRDGACARCCMLLTEQIQTIDVPDDDVDGTAAGTVFGACRCSCSCSCSGSGSL
jgi:hypothetical protein